MPGTVDDAGRRSAGSARRVKDGSGALAETVKWAQPVYEANGSVCCFRANRNHLTSGFWRGADPVGRSDRLETSGSKMAHIRIASAADIDARLIKRLVAPAAKLNAEKGDPTKGR